MLNDLEAGKGAWINIAQVVRQTFLSLFERLRIHGEQIKNLEREAILERRERKENDDKIAALVQNTDNIANSSFIIQEKEQRISNLEAEVRELKLRLEGFVASIPKKEDLQRVLAKKVDVRTLEDALQGLAEKEEVSNSIQDTRDEFQNKLEELQGKLEDDLATTAEGLAAATESLTDAEFMRNTITCEMLIGRWIWQGDRTGISVWKETVNTSQLIFETSSEASVRILRKGIYEVSLGCFSIREGNRDPVVQLLINNQVAITNEGPSSSTANGSQQKYNGFVRKPSNMRSLTGWSIHDYLALPADAEVAIRYRGEKAQGFISLKNIHCDLDAE